MKIQEAVVLPKEQPLPVATAEQRVVLHGIRWQTYEGELVTLYRWQVNGYETVRNSVVFPALTTQLLAEWMDASSYLKRNVWLRQIRSWARTVSSG